MTTLKPDFSHRLAHSNDDDASIEDQLIDSIGLMTERARGVLNSLMVQFESDDVSRVSTTLVAQVLYAVESEIEDIRAVVTAYCDAANKAG